MPNLELIRAKCEFALGYLTQEGYYPCDSVRMDAVKQMLEQVLTDLSGRSRQG